MAGVLRLRAPTRTDGPLADVQLPEKVRSPRSSPWLLAIANRLRVPSERLDHSCPPWSRTSPQRSRINPSIRVAVASRFDPFSTPRPQTPDAYASNRCRTPIVAQTENERRASRKPARKHFFRSANRSACDQPSLVVPAPMFNCSMQAERPPSQRCPLPSLPR